MSRIVQLKLLRTTQFELDKARDTSKLIEGEPYFVTDEARIAVARAVNDYRSMVKREGDTMLGKLTLKESSPAGGAGFNLQQGLAPVTPFNGDVWITSDGLFHRSNDITQRMVPANELRISDDIICNGDFYHNSFGGTWPAGTAAGTMFCDQWRGYNTTDASVVISRNATPPIISKYGNPVQMTLTASTADASLAASQLLMIYQYLEATKLVRWGWGYNMANPSIQPHMFVRFTARTNRAGTYYFTIISADGVISYQQPWVIDPADVNTSKEFVLRIPPPPLTPGIWNKDSRSCWVAWTFASGTTYQNALTSAWVGSGGHYCGTNISNPLQTAGFVMQLADIMIGQMVPGTTGLIAPPYRRKSIMDSVSECQRYYQTCGTWFSGDIHAGHGYYAKGTIASPFAVSPVFTWLSGSASACFGGAAGRGTYNVWGQALYEYRVALSTPAETWGPVFYSHLAADSRL